jgi:hypothetical protein
MDDADLELLTSLKRQADEVRDELQLLIPQIAEARRAYFKSREEQSKHTLLAIEQRGVILNDRMVDIVTRMQGVLGLSDEDFKAVERQHRTGDSVPRERREQLTVDKVESSGTVQDLLAASFERLVSMVDAHRVKEYAALPAPHLYGPTGNFPLSLVRGIRPESEYPSIHRFAQAITVARDCLEENPLYDHFAGAMLVPQIAQLAARLETLRDIPGALKRIKSLWRGASGEVDSTIFELLVGAACALKGRSVEFLDTDSSKTPDLMCHDPYPLAIECKRKRSLSVYEIEEEKCMRALFVRLEQAAQPAGMWGRFVLVLSVEAQYAAVDDIVKCLMMQRYAGGGGRLVDYAWGKVAYYEASARLVLPRPTRLYSPNMLQAGFDWNSDLADFDGLICRVSNAREPVVDCLERPLALLWSNLSEQALKKRSWGPMSVLKEALEQVPAGDFGIAYVAYQEGAREEMADSRTFGFSQWIKEFSHRDEIRVPLCKLVRLYPRALAEGGPDLIESTMNFVADYSDDVLPTLFPSRVFTGSEHRGELA